MNAELVLDARNEVGESPVWSAVEQALYWVDIPARTLNRWRAADGTTGHWTAGEMIGCIAPSGAGGWVAAMETGVFQLTTHADGTVASEPLASIQHPLPGMRFNDGRCDRQGRLRAGTMFMDMSAARAVGQLHGLEEGLLLPLVRDLYVPNGLAFSPDGRTMYLSDSHPNSQQVWAFDYDTDTGLPSNRRVFVDMTGVPGRPDGAAIDEDGCYWICANDAGLVHRFTPGGRLDRSLELPVKKPAMCAFGGAGMDTLFVTSIRPQGVDLSDQPLAGGVFAFHLPIRGLSEPACATISITNER